MQFYPWITSYDEYKAVFQKHAQRSEKPLSIREFNQHRKIELNKYSGDENYPAGHIIMQHDRLTIEDKWREDGKPYYNVHPFLVKKLCKVNLDKVPAKFVEMPHGYSAVAVKFAEPHEELTIHGGALGIPEGSYIKSILMTKGFNALRHYEDTKHYKESLYCMLNFCSKPGEHGEPNRLVVLPVWFKEDESLETALNNFMEGIVQSMPHDLRANIAEIDLNCLKIIVTIGFLANSNDKLIEPDVLSKLKAAYLQGTEEKRQNIVSKSRRTGKVGFNVGNDIMFLGEQPFQNKASHESTDRELNYAHIRTGHPHAVRYGPEKKLVKIMWYRSQTIRPDLPFKDE